jgi:hypothetical protein
LFRSAGIGWRLVKRLHGRFLRAHLHANHSKHKVRNETTAQCTATVSGNTVSGGGSTKRCGPCIPAPLSGLTESLGVITDALSGLFPRADDGLLDVGSWTSGATLAFPI